MKDFYCPLSTHINWRAGFKYDECPLVSTERDMPECRSCELQGDNAPQTKAKRRRRKEKEVIKEKDSKT